jgi:predicted restriction endonuclease
MKFELEKHHRNVADHELLDDLKNVSSEIGKPKVTIDEYNERGKFHATTLTRRFGSWFVALERAGLERTRNLNISDEELFENIVNVWTNLGKQPRHNDMTRDVSRFSAGTYEKRFNGWRKALEYFVEWANDGQLPDIEISSSLNSSHKTPRNINWRLRALVLMRDSARCQLCGATPQDGSKLHVDHIFPWSEGGETVVENLQILCDRCNIGKSDVIP